MSPRTDRDDGMCLFHRRGFQKKTAILFAAVVLLVTHSRPCGASRSPRCPRTVGENLSSHANCTCTVESGVVTKVNCTNAGFTDVNVLLDVPHTVEVLVFVGNNIPSLPVNLFGKCSSAHGHGKFRSLKTLDLSNNMIIGIHGKTFHCIPNLETLYLNNNKWFFKTKTKVFSNLGKLRKLSLINAFSERYINISQLHIAELQFILEDSNMTSLEELHLESNGLFILGERTFCGAPNLKRLYLNNNSIYTPIASPDCLRELMELDLSKNSLPSLTADSIALINSLGSLHKLSISDNPFSCDCTAADFVNWIKSNDSNVVLHKETLRCWFPDDTSQRIYTLDADKLYCEPAIDFSKVLRTPYIIIGIVFASIGVLFLIVLYLNRKGIKKSCREHIWEPLQESALGRDTRHGYVSTGSKV